MPLIVLDLKGAPQALLGAASRRLVEIRPGLFVGNSSRRSAEVLWDRVRLARPRSAILICPARNELGITLRAHGDHRFLILESDGLPLVGVVKHVDDAALQHGSAKAATLHVADFE